MRRSHLLLVTAALVLCGSRAFAQQPMSPYGEEPQPVQPAPIAPMQVPPPPPAVPPPVVVPPPDGYYQQPYVQQPYVQQPYAQPYYQQQPCPLPPPRLFHEEMQPNYGLMVAGLVIFGASWSINAASAYLADEWKLAVPVIGPFMETQNINTSSSSSFAEGNRMLVGLLVFDGLIESAGAIMLIAGAITHHKVRVYDHPRMSVSVVPTAGPAGGGLAAFGSF
jgi:hypothetical protein